MNASTPLDKNNNWLDLNLGDITKLVESKSKTLGVSIYENFILFVITWQQIMLSKKCI